jgi:hypothetical protein
MMFFVLKPEQKHVMDGFAVFGVGVFAAVRLPPNGRRR